MTHDRHKAEHVVLLIADGVRGERDIGVVSDRSIADSNRSRMQYSSSGKQRPTASEKPWTDWISGGKLVFDDLLNRDFGLSFRTSLTIIVLVSRSKPIISTAGKPIDFLPARLFSHIYRFALLFVFHQTHSSPPFAADAAEKWVALDFRDAVLSRIVAATSSSSDFTKETLYSLAEVERFWEEDEDSSFFFFPISVNH